jgi:hypothetical protein
LIKALRSEDASGDLTKPAWTRAREALKRAAGAYCTAHDAFFGGGTPADRRTAERAHVRAAS